MTETKTQSRRLMAAFIEQLLEPVSAWNFFLGFFFLLIVNIIVHAILTAVGLPIIK